MFFYATLASTAFLTVNAESPIPHPLDELRRRTEDDSFTVVFFADLENNYRGHTEAHSKRFLEALTDLGEKNLKFDGEYSHVKIDPKLFIHGGDINRDGWQHGWDIRDPLYLKDGLVPVDWEFSDVWDVMYDKGFPAVSVFGNHDWAAADIPIEEDRDFSLNSPGFWDVEEQVESNRKTMEFTRRTMEKSRPHGVQFTAVNPPGEVGPTFYVADFRGVQLVLLQQDLMLGSFDLGPDGKKSESYDTEEQLSQVRALMDKDKTTLVVQHFPLDGFLRFNPTGRREMARIMEGIPEEKGAFFTGHYHKQETHKQYFNGKVYTDYTAAYPHEMWNSKTHQPGQPVDTLAGAYAILVSPERGVLQVKNIDIHPKCWERGTHCLAGTTCDSQCCRDSNYWSYWYSKGWTACGFEDKWEDGTRCLLGTTCKACKNEATHWHGNAITSCGTEPKWGDGTVCLLGTSCRQCRNKATYWHSKVMTACGTDPVKWADGTICWLGTSCNQCKNSASYWHGKWFTACGSEPKWGSGEKCLAGTSCKQCKNGSEWWWSKFSYVCK